MPGIGHDQPGPHPQSDPPGIAVGRLLGQHRYHRRRQGDPPRIGETFRVQQAVTGIDNKARGHRQQQQSDHHRGQGFKTLITVGVGPVRPLAAQAGGEQHQAIADQIRQGVDTVRHQGLGLADHARQHLEYRQHQIDQGPDQGNPPLCRKSIRYH